MIQKTEPVHIFCLHFTLIKTYVLISFSSFVLQKMSKICVNPVAKKTFENKFTKYTCEDILDFNNTKAICNNKNEANTSMVQANNDFTEFLFA